MNRNVAVDRLRGVSVLVVICMHYGPFFPSLLTGLGEKIWNGYYGVTAFFCTSGALITANLLRRYGQVAAVDLYAFYVMRFSRIVPPLALLVVTLSLLSTTEIERFVFPAPISLAATLKNIALLRYNHYYQHGGGLMIVWAILWSLSIEEVFYLGYPVLAKVARTVRWLSAALVAVIVYAAFHKIGRHMALYDYFGCFDAIAMGALSALAAARFSPAISRGLAWGIMATGIVILVCTYLLTIVQFQYIAGPTLTAVGASLVLFASRCEPFASTRPLACDPVAYLGRLSYEIYLFHVTIYALLRTVIVPRYPGLVFAISLLCVVAVSHLIHEFYSEPLNRWLRAVLMSRHKPGASKMASVQPPALRATVEPSSAF